MTAKEPTLAEIAARLRRRNDAHAVAEGFASEDRVRAAVTEALISCDRAQRASADPGVRELSIAVAALCSVIARPRP